MRDACIDFVIASRLGTALTALGIVLAALASFEEDTTSEDVTIARDDARRARNDGAMTRLAAETALYMTQGFLYRRARELAESADGSSEMEI